MKNIAQQIYKEINRNNVRFSEYIFMSILREEKVQEETINIIFKNLFVEYINDKIGEEESFVELFKGKKEEKDKDYDKAKKILLALRNFLIHYNCKIADLENTDFTEESTSIEDLFRNKNLLNYTRLEINEKLDFEILNIIINIFDYMIKKREDDKFKVKLLIQEFVERKTQEELKSFYCMGINSIRKAKVHSINSFCRALRELGYF